jgi:exodeoxyribonuclease VII small subunit
MTDKLPKTFEQKLARIDAIVKELEGGTVELQRATELFKEGKLLARDCEALLKSAQEQIDEAMAEPQSGSDDAGAAAAPELEDELPF